ncbi:MAG: hypothetical protein ACLR5G_15795 [Eubacteriales bacterium]
MKLDAGERFDEFARAARKTPVRHNNDQRCSHRQFTLLTLDELSRRAEIMRERMMSARAAGFSAGINILATIGHHSEDLAHSPLGPDTAT